MSMSWGGGIKGFLRQKTFKDLPWINTNNRASFSTHLFIEAGIQQTSHHIEMMIFCRHNERIAHASQARTGTSCDTIKHI